MYSLSHLHYFIVVNIHSIVFTILTKLSVEISGIKYVHVLTHFLLKEMDFNDNNYRITEILEIRHASGR